MTKSTLNLNQNSEINLFITTKHVIKQAGLRSQNEPQKQFCYALPFFKMSLSGILNVTTF